MTPIAPRLALALTFAVAVVASVPAFANAENLGFTGASTGQASTGSSTGRPVGRSATQVVGPTRTVKAPRVLSERLRGRAAVRTLGTDLPSVARANSLSSAQLSEILTTDRTAWVSRAGKVFFEEDAPAQTSTEIPTAAATVAPAYPTAQTFELHSNPTASRKIFLDFDGATVTNTAWNGTGPGDITNATHIGFDTDGAPSTFSSSEHGFVQEVWRQVAETYAPFDVDVTTADPGTSGITRSSVSDTTYGTQVLITSSNTPREQVCGGCLGVAFLGTFDQINSSPYYQPAWVFAYSTTFDPMIVAQAASHETGHNLGLQHDGTSTASYYAGTAAWGPIMGSSRTRAISQFSNGEYNDADNQEDDFAVMGGNGLPLRSDDHGDTTQSAQQLGALQSYNASGVISTRSDTDVFAITLPCLTNLTVAATGVGAQSTLDLKLDVLGPDGGVLATSSPASTYSGSPPRSGGMNAQVVIPAATGTYFLRADGVGEGNPAGSGWSDYGSLGQFRLTASGCADQPAGPPPAEDPPAGPPPTTDPEPAATKPAAPVIGSASSGTKGGTRNAVARWSSPVDTGGAEIVKYRVRAQRLDSRNRVVRTYGSSYQKPSARSLRMKLPRGRYVFSVMAGNSVGSSTWSRSSRGVYSR